MEAIGMLPANPYDLHELIFNGQKIYARPIEWNGSLVDQNNNKNGFGLPFKATKLILTCPDCAELVEFNILDDLDGEYHCKCAIIPAKKIKDKTFVDVFKSPFIDNSDMITELYPSLQIDKPDMKRITKPRRKASKSCKLKIEKVDTSTKAAERTQDIIDLASQPFDDTDLLE
jgi:hypothetical protein